MSGSIEILESQPVMCRVGKSVTKSSNRIIKRSHQSILESNKQVVSIIIESWSISLEELLGGVVVVVELCL